MDSKQPLYFFNKPFVLEKFWIHRTVAKVVQRVLMYLTSSSHYYLHAKLVWYMYQVNEPILAPYYYSSNFIQILLVFT